MTLEAHEMSMFYSPPSWLAICGNREWTLVPWRWQDLCRQSSSSLQPTQATIRLLHQILWPWNVNLGLVKDMALWAKVCLFVSLVKVKWLAHLQHEKAPFSTPKSLFMRIRQFGCFFRATVLRYLSLISDPLGGLTAKGRHHMKPRGNFEGIQIFSDTWYPVTTVPKKTNHMHTRYVFAKFGLRLWESGSRWELWRLQISQARIMMISSSTMWVLSISCLIQGKLSACQNLGSTNKIRAKVKIFAWLMSSLWQTCGFGVAVVARAFRNGVAIGLGCFIFFNLNLLFWKIPYDIAYPIVLLFVALSSLVILKLRDTRYGAQRWPACFSCALFCLVAMAMAS